MCAHARVRHKLYEQTDRTGLIEDDIVNENIFPCQY
jgi:hypothetical protein